NGLTVAEDDGGMGADAIFLAVAAEKLGRHGVPGPVAETLAVAPALLSEAAPDRLEALAEAALATVAAPPAAPYAVDADTADTVLRVDESAGAAGAAVALAETGAVHESIDRARRLCDTTAAQQLGTITASALAEAHDRGAL